MFREGGKRRATLQPLAKAERRFGNGNEWHIAQAMILILVTRQKIFLQWSRLTYGIRRLRILPLPSVPQAATLEHHFSSDCPRLELFQDVVIRLILRRTRLPMSRCRQ
jgi:hypothetical protein